MTYEEAHKFLEVKQREMTQNRHLYNETAIAINGKAIEALEKQIPRKPNTERQDMCLAFWCPGCNSLLINKYSHGFIVGEKEKFCYECGQHIDWSDEE